MRFLLTAILLAAPLAAGAQNALKCRDAPGKITYSSEPCESLGLKNEGEVPNRVTVAPATKVPPRAAPPAAPVQAPAAAPAVPPKAEAESDERRCFKTAGGTRCNDVPGSGSDLPKK